MEAVAKGRGKEFACLSLTEDVVVDAKPNLVGSNQKVDDS